MALGAEHSDITKMVTASGARLAVLGIAIGVVASATFSRLISSLLFGVTSTDPMTFAFTALGLGAVTVSASYIPSRRAANTDPVTALRYD
jgi:putative ABC transport system permease protein